MGLRVPSGSPALPTSASLKASSFEAGLGNGGLGFRV